MGLPPQNYISLFAGAGGLDLGLRIACPEARAVCYLEREATAIEILVARIQEGSLDDAPIYSDVRTFDGRLYRGRVAGIIGGFPCTDLSVAGRGEGISGEHSGLWFEYLRIIEEAQPDWAFIENVPGIFNAPGGDLESGGEADGDSAGEYVRNVDAVLGPLSEIGYDAEWLCLRASDVGAAHKRTRFFCLAHRPGARLPGWKNAVANCGDAGEDRRGRVEFTGIGGIVEHAKFARWPPTWSGSAIDAGAQYEPGGGHLDNAARDRQPGREREVGRRRGRRIREGRDPVAVPAVEGLAQRPDRAGDGGEAPGDTPAERTGTELADADSGESTEYAGDRSGRPEAKGCGPDSESPGCNELLADADSERRQQESGGPPCDEAADGRTRRDWSQSDGDYLTSGLLESLSIPGPGLGGAGVLDDIRDLYARNPQRAWERYQAELRNTLRWTSILQRYPWLAPSLSEEEAFTYLRGRADVLANLVVLGRTAALRATGNGVVPLCAAAAFVELVRRIK